MTANVIEFEHVWKKFRTGEKINSLRDALPSFARMMFSARREPAQALGDREFWALRDVTVRVRKGEIVGIIGPNGAGKSTILKLLSRIMAPNDGAISISGRLSALIEVTAGFHPELTGRENVYLNGTILGMTRREIDRKFDRIVEFSGLKDFIETPVKRYSSGMYSRLGFSVAAHMDPDILLVDEVLAVGDIAFQSKCARKMRELLRSGATIVLISHDLALVQNLCRRVILIDAGVIEREGPAGEIIPYYQEKVQRASERELRGEIKKAAWQVKVREESGVRITSVSFGDEQAAEGACFSPDDRIKLRMALESRERLRQPVIAVDIYRSDGILCCSSNSRADGCSIEAVNGKSIVEVDMGRIGLAPGIYVPKITVWDSGMLHPYCVRKSDLFRCSAGTSAPGGGGVFVRRFNWRHDGAAEGVHG